MNATKANGWQSNGLGKILVADFREEEGVFRPEENGEENQFVATKFDGSDKTDLGSCTHPRPGVV